MSTETDAAKCRRMGWGVGTMLEGTEHVCAMAGTSVDVICITAIGDELVLARCVMRNGRLVTSKPEWHERTWTLAGRDWQAAEIAGDDDGN